MIKVMYVLGLTFGVFAGLISAAFSFMLFEFTCVMVCMCDSAQPAELPQVAQLVRATLT